MTTEETNRFVDCLIYEDNTIRFHQKIYWCLGLTRYPDSGKFCIQVYEADSQSYEFVKDILVYESESRDECMRHFLEDRYWDGKSFYEVAHEMEWIDL